MNVWRMKSIQIGFKQFQKIDQELNARFVKLRLAFQICVLLLLTPILLGKNKQIANAAVSSAVFFTGKLDYI